jgi:putative nucleotidyltransferase with HDIG domain
MTLTEWAYTLAESLLAEPLPRRWRHSQGVARRASELRPILGEEADLMEAAGILHDIGYSPTIAHTGFHPLDGARFLRDQDADERVVRLVAHHSCAILEADLRGLRDDLEAEFKQERSELVDAMIFCDMTTTPDGEKTTSTERLREIANRYGPEDLVTRFINRAAPDIHAATERVYQRIAAARIS